MDDDTLEHAKAGYANAQEVIRFIDTKAGAVIGLATLTMGVPVVTFQWLASQNGWSDFSFHALTRQSHWPCTVAAIAGGFGMIFGVLVIISALLVLRARSPFKKSHITVLFPMYDAKTHITRAHRVFSKIRSGMSRKEVAREYEMQIRRVGAILDEKACRLNIATKWYTAQLVAYGIAAISLLAAYSLTLLTKSG